MLTSTKESAAEADGQVMLGYLTSSTIRPVWLVADWFVRSQVSWEKNWNCTQDSSYSRLTMAEMTRTTLTGSPHPDGGVPLFSRTKRHTARIPSPNCNREKELGGRAGGSVSCGRAQQPGYLPIVPRPLSNLILRAVVDSSDLVQDVLLPLLL